MQLTCTNPFRQQMIHGMQQFGCESQTVSIPFTAWASFQLVLIVYFNHITMVRKEDIHGLLPTMDELLPRQFYKSKSTPRTALGPMLGFAIVTYIAAIVAFIMLVVKTSKNYITDISIESSDLTGTDGYTCKMISKVTNSFTENSATDPTTSYYLVNIIESQSQCVQDLTTADPCVTTQTYIPGSASTWLPDMGVLYVATAFYGNDLAYMFDYGGHAYTYNYTDGTIASNNTGAPVYDFQNNFVGVDNLGQVYFLQRFNDWNCFSTICVIQAGSVPSNEASVVATYDILYEGIINDNLYNLYLYTNTSVYAVDYSSDVPSHVLLLALNATQAPFYSIAVFTSPEDNTRTIYYNSIEQDFTTFYKHVDGVSTKLTTLDPFLYPSTPLVTDGTLLYFPCLYSNQFSGLCFAKTFPEEYGYGHVGDSGQLSSVQIFQSIAISSNGGSNGTRVFSVSSSNGVYTENMYFYYPHVKKFELIAYQYDFAAGWFTCGEEIITSVPARTSVYTSECDVNGVVGEVLYREQNKYLFTPTDASAYALRTSAPYCRAIYNQVCKKVANLPPYSCSKKVYPTFFTIVGTAYANTMFMLSILIFVFSLSLTRMAKRYPPPGTNVHPSATEVDVEMTTTGTVTANPIGQSEQSYN